MASATEQALSALASQVQKVIAIIAQLVPIISLLAPAPAISSPP